MTLADFTGFAFFPEKIEGRLDFPAFAVIFLT
jgi:hypothetical protein